MRQTLLLLTLLVQMLFAPQPAWTQSNYPIYVSPTLLPPYSLKLSDYSAYGSQRMMVTIVVNDLEVANLPVKLRVKMETAGVSIENPITINTTPIYIDGGSATVLFGEDLVDYFNINNLQFKGYSKEAYKRSGQMPEGFYRFSVEVLHFHTNRVISNTGSVTAWIALGKPPVLRAPGNEVELGQYMGVPLTFSWLASNVGSPVSAGSVRYKFEMWEVRVKGINPYTIVSSIPVFHEFVTSSTTYSFNPAGVMMEEGLTYAWRVTAFDESGLVPFEQNGQSEVRTFRFKSLCEEVQAVTTTASGQKGSFTWTPDRNHTSYNVEVRNSASDWFLANETFDSKVEFYELERGQTYEIRVQAVCNGDASSVSDYTEWTALTIPEAQPKDNTDDCPDCGCSDDLPDVTLSNFELRQDLAPGDTLSNKTGTTRFVVKSVEPQGDGIYKGVFYFWAEIWDVKIPCDFWDLQVNTDDVIVNMDYQSINDPMFLVDVDALIATGNEFLDNMAVVTTSTAIVDTISVFVDFEYLVVEDGQLVAIVLNGDGEPIPTPLNITAEHAEKALITNEYGDEVVVTSKGEVMGVKEYQATGGNRRLMQDYKKEKESNELSEGTMVTFAPHAAQKFGFDRYNEEKTALQYLYPTLHNGYRPAFKSVESFRYDKVGVDLTEGLTFRDEMGVPAIAMDGGVSVQGTQSGSNRAFYAYRALTDSTEELVGKLNVMSFDNAPKRVHIIPVNDATIPSQIDLQKTLNRVYSQAVATWTVVPEKGVILEFPGGRMTHDGAGKLKTYNDDQEAIVNAYVASGRQMERDDLYLFYVKDATFKDRSLAGYMPLQRQVGFIYDNPTLEIVAHELGHGAFNLRHTFSPKAYLAPEGKTQNLMDYAGGTELWQNQWDLIHNPEKILFSWSQSEEEGAFGILTHQNMVAEAITKIDGSLELNERNFKLLISTGLLADGGSILCEVNEGMKNAEITEELSVYLNSKISDLYTIFDSPYNILKRKWIDYWATSIEFPNMRNVFRRSWQYGSEMKESVLLFKDYFTAVAKSEVKFEKLVITPNNQFKIELLDITLLEHPDVLFDLLFQMQDYRMQDYMNVTAEMETLVLNGEGIDLIPEWISTDVNVSSQSSLSIRYYNKDLQSDLFKVTFDVSASLVNSVELVMSLNDTPFNFPLTCEEERIEIHFDSKYQSSDVLNEWAKLENKLSAITGLDGDGAIDLGLLLHNVADFYAHSNFIIEYIDWWMEQPGTDIKTLKPEHIPTYNEVVTGASNELGLDWGAFWQQYEGDMFTGAWTLELMMDRLNQREMELPRPFHDDIALDSSDSGRGADKPDKAALCNYFEYARGAAYKHIYQILKDKLK